MSLRNPLIRSLLSLWLCLSSLPLLAGAQQDDCASQQSDCIAENSWQIGVAVGLGARSNPLVDGDTIPRVLLFDIAWYGEQIYFDNAELGYQWQATPTLQLSNYLNLDKEAAAFSFWHPANFILTGSETTLDTSQPNLPGNNSTKISKNHIASRRWALHAGLSGQWQALDGDWKLALEQDISGTHNGQKAHLAYRYYWQWQQFRFSLNPSLSWRSSKLVDYYYGLDERDKIRPRFYYQASGGVQPAIQIDIKRHLTGQWQALFSAAYLRWHKSMYASPLIKEKSTRSVFIGVAYVFE